MWYGSNEEEILDGVMLPLTVRLLSGTIGGNKHYKTEKPCKCGLSFFFIICYNDI
jgi:hypothetical protein